MNTSSNTTASPPRPLRNDYDHLIYTYSPLCFPFPLPRCVVFMREQGDGTLNIRIMEIRKKRIINARRICYTG